MIQHSEQCKPVIIISDTSNTTVNAVVDLTVPEVNEQVPEEIIQGEQVPEESVQVPEEIERDDVPVTESQDTQDSQTQEEIQDTEQRTEPDEGKPH
jgi:hypothetical protein